ncbi:MAG TPA: protein kinase [Myxococcaceae bacterium]|nr:protein kinase [Myxococcaceae bacterium]
MLRHGVDVKVENSSAALGHAAGLGEGWELRLSTGRGAGSVLLVPREGAVLGSSRECELVLSDDGVAPRHLRLYETPDGRLGFVHLGGRWPTLLEGEPRTSGGLQEGSKLQVGAVLLSVARRAMTAPPGVPAAEDDEPPLTPGTVVADRYRIQELVGRGGMGAVYRAEHLTLGNTVAVKVLRASHGAHPDIVRRFQREAVAASQIRHPGIVEVTDFGRTRDDRFYLAMEFVDGETLARRLARLGPLASTEAVTLVRSLAQALGAAHARGIYHRDIKPENVLLTPDGHAKLADFGIARLAEGPRDARETAAGLIFGTPHYMSPEQAAGQKQDGRSDVYALGVLLFELLTGAPPFVGASATHVLAAHLLSPVPRLPAQGSHGPIPSTLADLVGRMMAKEAAERPATMAEVEAALDAVLSGQALPPPSRRPRTGPSTWAAAVLAALAVLATVVLVARRPGPPPPVSAAPVAAPPPAAPATAQPAPPSTPPAITAPRPEPAPPAARSTPSVARPERPAPVAIELRSTPPGARVTLHGRLLGVTPLSVRLPPQATALLVFEADGRTSIAERVRPRPGLVVTVHLPPTSAAPGLEDLKASPY